MMKKFILLLIILLCFICAPNSMLANIQQHTIANELSKNGLDTTYFNDFKQQNEFQYKSLNQNPSWLQFAITRWIVNAIDNIISFEQKYPVIRSLSVVLVIAILLFYIFRGSLSGLFILGEKNKSDETQFWKEQFISEPLELLLERSIGANDFKNAVRYMYLLVLQQLSGAKIIKLQPSQTVSDQLAQLSGKAFYPKILFLANWYQYLVFGSYTIDDQRFDSIKSEFYLVMQQIGKNEIA